MTPIFQDILSIFFVLALGYLSGRSSAFTQAQADGFSRLVLDYALPASLFLSIISASRAEVLAHRTDVGLALVVLVGWYVLAVLVARLVFGHSRQEAGLAGLSATAPTVGFLGIAVLAPLFGQGATLGVAVVALVVNIVQIPLGVILAAPSGTSPLAAIAGALRQPVVAAPLLAVVFVATGLRFPAFADAPLALIGSATSGVAVFTAGLILSLHRLRLGRETIWNAAVKLVLMPASMLLLGRIVDLPADTLEQLVLIAALPPVFTGMILATRYGVYAETAASTLIVTMLLFAGAAPMWIAIVRSLD